MKAYAATAANSTRLDNNQAVLREVKCYAATAAAWSPDSNQAVLRQVRAYVAQGTRFPDSNEVLRGMRGYAAVTDTRKPAASKREALQEMRGYASAGFLQGGVELGAVAESPPEGYPHVLISYVYDKDHSFFERKLGYNPADWLGDSGAFTAWTQGETVDLAAYIDWCHYYREHKESFVCVSLDVIAGSRETPPTKKEAAKAIRESLENGDAMRAAGLSIMEVYHQWEPLSHLDALLDRRQSDEVLGISPRDRRPPSERMAFCEGVFARLRDRDGWDSLTPCHGLGVSPTSPLASRFPWWSVDASTWIASAMFGHEVLPGGKKGAPDSRNSHRELRKLYLMRTLTSWLAREQALTRLWESRGIRFDIQSGDDGGS